MLNSEQQRAVEAVRGPVRILAGAGSGKTTTITHRVANQVASGAFRSDQILAVSFTDKAAGEMRSRLEELGVPGVRCSTFHAAALGQLRFFAAEPPRRILASKALPLRYIGNRLPRPYRFRPAADLATDIEWAKNRRIAPDRYRSSLEGSNPPIPADLMLRVYTEYERRKSEEGWVDFEDLIEMTIRLLDADEGALNQVRERYQAFTVDEYHRMGEVGILPEDNRLELIAVAAALMHRYRGLQRLKYWKPVQTGIESSDDTKTVETLGNCVESELHRAGIRPTRTVEQRRRRKADDADDQSDDDQKRGEIGGGPGVSVLARYVIVLRRLPVVKCRAE